MSEIQEGDVLNIDTVSILRNGCLFDGNVYGHRYQLCTCGRHIWSMASKKVLRSRLKSGRRPKLRDAITGQLIDIDEMSSYRGVSSTHRPTLSMPNSQSSFESDDMTVYDVPKPSTLRSIYYITHCCKQAFHILFVIVGIITVITARFA